MPEITADDLPAVAKFIREKFLSTAANKQMTAGQAHRYALIAAFLSSWGSVKQHLRTVSDAVEAEYNRLASTDSKSNVLSRAIISVANLRGWATQGNVVLQGFIRPDDIVKYVRNKVMWKDAVSSLHGEFSHSLQWLAVSAYAKGDMEIPWLYSESVNYRSTNTFKRPAGSPSPVYLWDFLVDCFNFGGAADYQTNIITGTCRSPAGLMKYLMEDGANLWIAAILRDRYNRRNWSIPDGKGTQVDLADYAKGKHMTGNDGKNGYVARRSGANYVLERDDAHRSDRSRTARGFQSLQGTLLLESGAWAVPKVKADGTGTMYSCNTAQHDPGTLKDKGGSRVTFELWPNAVGQKVLASNLRFL